MDQNLSMEDSGIDSDPKTSTRVEDENIFAGSDSSSSSSTTQPPVQKSTTKQLQRKLEARIEQAKRIQRNSQEYTKLPDNEPDNCGNSSNISLIPIQRLPIPQKRKKQNMLIELGHSESDSEDEMTLFSSRKNGSIHKQDLTDTFSIEELSEGSEDSLHLGTTPEIQPNTRTLMPSGCFSCHCLIL